MSVEVDKNNYSKVLQCIERYKIQCHESQRRYEAFMKQKFTFIKALERDFSIGIGSHTALISAIQLHNIHTNMALAEQLKNHVDYNVVGLWLSIFEEVQKFSACLLETHEAIKHKMSSVGVDVSQQDQTARMLEKLVHPQFNATSLHDRYHVFLNDRETLQFGGFLNLIPYILETANSLINFLYNYTRMMVKEELERINAAQFEPPKIVKPITPPRGESVETQTPFKSSKADSSTQLDAQVLVLPAQAYHCKRSERGCLYSSGHLYDKCPPTLPDFTLDSWPVWIHALEQQSTYSWKHL